MRYVGSKAKYAKEIVPILQNIIDKMEITLYQEPFVGGANIIDKIKCAYRRGYDIDTIPITLFWQAQKNPKVFDKMPEQITKEHYYFARDYGKDYILTEWYRSAVLLFGSYNSRVYGGCYGAMTTTREGKIRNYYQESLNNFKKQIPAIKDITFIQGDYRNIPSGQTRKLIYCDPPYKKGIGYANEFDTDEFWQWVREQSKKHIVVVSEETAPSDFKEIWSSESRSHMNNRKTKPRTEKLFIIRSSPAWEVL